jgi:hypothetical protein
MIAEKMMQRITREDREKEFEQERKEGRLHLLPRRGRAWEGVRNRWRSMAELEAWLDDVERRTRFPLAVAEPLHAAPVETWDTVRGPVRSPVRGVDVSSVDTPVTVESFVEIVDDGRDRCFGGLGEIRSPCLRVPMASWCGSKADRNGRAIFGTLRKDRRDDEGTSEPIDINVW